MSKKTTVALILSTLIIIVGASESFARPQYLTSLNEVYGSGSCNTCHVMASGRGSQDSNGTFDSHNTNGTYVRNSNRTNESRNFNRTSGVRNSNRTMPRNSYGKLFEDQPDHATDPGAALIAIGAPTTTTPTVTIVATGSKAAPGFGIVLSLVGLFACALLLRRYNK